MNKCVFCDKETKNKSKDFVCCSECRPKIKEERDKMVKLKKAAYKEMLLDKSKYMEYRKLPSGSLYNAMINLLKEKNNG